MKILVITKTRGRTGKVMQQKREVTADWVRIGRAASSEIFLPDPRVALFHGLIGFRNGLVYNEGEAGIVGHSSTTQRSVLAIRLRPGTSVEVGPYTLTALETPEGFDGAVSVELVRPLEAPPEGDIRDRSRQVTLASLRLPKRSIAWALLGLIVVAGLLLPASKVLNTPWLESAKALGADDRLWNPGPVIRAHQPIEMKCESCHEVAFQHVKDGACLACHGKVGHHLAPGLMPAGLFDGKRCTSCHVEHKSAKATHRDDDSFCVDCHRDIRKRAPGAASENVADFTLAHPAFRVNLPAAGGMTRVRQATTPMKEASNLMFPHVVHLDPKGVRSPRRGRVNLECGTCHKPDASGRTFEPISMKTNCQECHRLEFEPAVTTREVPHGSPREAKVVIEEFYANLALNGVRDSFTKAFGVPGEGLLRRVGEPSEAERTAAASLAAAKARKVSIEMMEVRVCAACHDVKRLGKDKALDWEVPPVRASHTWMPKARFDHRSHAQSKCADCHDVAGSKVAADVAIPAIDTCRKCHGGSEPASGKVTSNCMQCHGFHIAGHPWDQPPAKATTRVAGGGADAR